MLVKELKDDHIIKAWFLKRNVTEETKKSFLASMQQFTEYTGKNPEELILEAEAEIRAGLLMRERKIDTYLPEFRKKLEEKKLAPLTVKNRMTGVCSFYRSNNIPLPDLPDSVKKANPQLKRKKIPEKKDIREVLKYADSLEKAVILTGLSSGLSVVDICDLKISEFEEGYDPVTKITILHLVRIKTDYEFYTALSPEASQSILDYLKYRNRVPKADGNENRRKQQLEKQKVTSKDGYLFVSRSIPDKYLELKNEAEKEEMRKLDKKAVLAMYRRLNEDAQANSAKGEYNLVRTHSLRRFFNSALLNEGAQMHTVDFMMGHKIDATHEGYYRRNPLKLKEEYSKYIGVLTIEEAIDPTEHPVFVQMKANKETFETALAVTVSERQQERSALKDLQSQYNKLSTELERIKKKEELTAVIREEEDPDIKAQFFMFRKFMAEQQ